MILEVVHWNIKEGKESDFESAFAQAEVILASMGGYIDHQLQKCIENPRRYILLVRWQTLEDHTKGFQQSDQYQHYKALIVPYFEPGTTLEHFSLVAPG